MCVCGLTCYHALCLYTCLCDCVQVYPHGSTTHASVNSERTLSRGANALHDDAQYGAPTVFRLTDQTVIQVDFPGERERESKLIVCTPSLQNPFNTGLI